MANNTRHLPFESKTLERRIGKRHIARAHVFMKRGIDRHRKVATCEYFINEFVSTEEKKKQTHAPSTTLKNYKL